jgi:predicted kinase
MSRVIFMCGPAGSGKSTIARQFEAEGMGRLSIDGEAWRLGHRSMPLPESDREQIESELRRRLVELVAAGTDVVLDLSFWSRRMRDDYRALVRSAGAEPETVYLATPRDVALGRVRERRQAHADDFQLTEEEAATYFDQFEIPTADEGPLRIVS